jgi:hypothetical protein
MPNLLRSLKLLPASGVDYWHGFLVDELRPQAIITPRDQADPENAHWKVAGADAVSPG